MQPINYTLDVKNPIDSALQGYATGLQINGAQDQQAMKQLAIQKAQQDLDQQQQMQQDFSDAYKNPSLDNLARLSIKYPQQSENITRSFNLQSTVQQQQTLSNATQVLTALEKDSPEDAINILTNQATAFRNAGQEAQAHATDTILQTIQTSPALGKIGVFNYLSAIPGGDKVIENLRRTREGQQKDSLFPSELKKSEADATIKGAEAGTINQKLQTENAYKAAQTKDVNSQIADRSARLSLDKDKFQSDVQMKLMEFQQKAGTLDGEARKLLNDSVINSVTSEQTSNQLSRLADNLERVDGSSGAYGSAKEWLKGATGNQDAYSEYKKEFNRLMSSQIIKLLPPGSASDADLAMVKSGFPPENASPAYLAKFLRSMANINQFSAVNDSAKAEWINSVGHWGKPKSNINVDGLSVPAGTTYNDFARAYIEAKTEQKMIQGRQDSIKKGGASYMNTGGASGSY